MRRRLIILLTVTGVLLFGIGIAVWYERHHGLVSSEPAYIAKRDQIISLQRIKGTRSFTSKEMALLRQFVQDPDWRMRMRALTALWDTQDPQQRQEAIQLARERLKDHEWVVRSYALHALARLGAKEAVQDILPLLNDPHPDVRNWAQRALKQLGYEVR